MDCKNKKNLQNNFEELLKEYSFTLPNDLIARHPAEPADSCRLMSVRASANNRPQIKHDFFYNLPQLLHPDDLLVVNNTKVEARRVFLLKKSVENSSRFETVFLQTKKLEAFPKEKETWQVLMRGSKKISVGQILVAEIDSQIFFEVQGKENGFVFLKPSVVLNENIFSRIGQMPIPPYMNREANEKDKKDYQSIFSQQSGSAAAPTASLHFTSALLKNLQEKNIQMEHVTLHVGYGTFAPLREGNFLTEKLHEEFYEIPSSLAERLQKKDYRRLIAVGTTVLRVLETVFQKTEGKYNHSLKGNTDIFLFPPYTIQSADALITNFHLPASSLLLLTACMLPKELLLQSYNEAIQKQYMFYSYGDAMFIEK